MSPFTDIKDYQRFVKDKAKESAELKRRVVEEYHLGLKAGTDEVSLRMSLKERFNLTDQRLNNFLDGRVKYLNAKEQAFTSGLVMNHYVTLIRAANEAIQGFDEYLEYIEQEKDRDFIEVEEYASAKGSGTKSLTPRELRGKVLRDKFDIVKDSFEPLKALAPKIIQVQGDGLRFDTMEELEEQERIEIERLKINKGEQDEKN